MRSFSKVTGLRDSDWLGKYWARWGDAVTEAGLVRNSRNLRLDDSYLLENYAKLVRAMGRLPVKAEVELANTRDPLFPTYQTLLRFGHKPALVSKVADWCGANGYDDVVAICTAAIPPKPAAKPSEVAPPADVGGVYLLKSGRFYKIGRSNAVGRREREISIQLPEHSVLIHEIRTDDPPGIEQYWHKRFAQKRAKGEWFSLSAIDVAAFKRRKFM